MFIIRRIRELLYEQGFTISGARNKLDSHMANNEDLAKGVPILEIDTVMIRQELTEILNLLKP